MILSKQFIKRIKIVFYFFLGLIYAYVLTSIPHIFFKDRDNYLTIYADWFDMYFNNLVSWKTFLFTEPLFFYLNKLLYYFNDPSLTVCVFIFINTFFICSFCFKRSQNFFLGVLLLLLIFFNPQSFALQLVTIRQGLGVVLLLLFYNRFDKRYIDYLVIFIASLIHTSFYIILLFVVFYDIMTNLMKIKTFNIKILYILILGVAVNSASLVISNALGTKQEVSSEATEVSGLMFLLWGAVFVYLLFFKKYLLEEDSLYKSYYILSLIGLSIYLTGYFLSPIAGRIIGTFIPFIYLSILYKMRKGEILLVLMLLFINIYLFFNGGAESFMLKSLNDVFL